MWDDCEALAALLGDECIADLFVASESDVEAVEEEAEEAAEEEEEEERRRRRHWFILRYYWFLKFIYCNLIE